MLELRWQRSLGRAWPAWPVVGATSGSSSPWRSSSMSCLSFVSITSQLNRLVTLVFFWVGVLCAYLLALFSLPQLHDVLGQRLRRILRTIAVEYIALVFASDFI